MRIKPKENYILLGTSIKLNKDKIYPGSYATNQPDYKKRQSIFVYYDNHGGSMLLTKGEYTKTDKPCNL